MTNRKSAFVQNVDTITTDTLRSIATLFVFFLHGRSFLPAADQLTGCWKWITYFPAWGGVWIFLFLSGYGIGKGFLSGKYSVIDQDGNILVRGLVWFYVNRFLKIAPFYYTYCFLFEVLGANSFYWQDREVLLRMLTFTFHGIGGISGLGHLWYISMAVQLYFFMPFFDLIIQSLCQTWKRLAVGYIFITVAGLGLRILFFKAGRDWQTQIYTNSFLNLDLIAAGMLTAKADMWFAAAIKRKYQVMAKVAAWIFFCILVLFNCYIYWIGTEGCIDIYRYILPTAYIISCTLIIFTSAQHKQNKMQSVCLQKVQIVVKKFSRCSYVFYIFHICVLEYLGRTMVSTAWFCGNSPRMQYVIYYTIAIAMLLPVSVFLSKIGYISYGITKDT